MPNRLADAVSPYLRAHADNPVDWWPWSAEAFDEARRRDVPVLVSIGYATCHWCHVMARESFSDPVLAAWLNDRFVAIKVDREEHPDVDASYLSAASAFTDQLGWPLTVLATPEGRPFYAGTYFPPQPVQGVPAFRQVLEAVLEAFTEHRDEVETSATRLVEALRAAGEQVAATTSGAAIVPDEGEFAATVGELEQYEDTEYGGFGGAPKFPVASVLGFLLDRGDAGDPAAEALAHRTLDAMADSPLRDRVEGGFFRYATRRDWSEPHYERMLYDNALLLDAYSRAGRSDVAAGIADFLLGVMRVGGGGFASAQDSESTVDGRRVEGGYYALTAAERADQDPPALDEKVLTGWNGLAIGALASAGVRDGHPDWVAAAEAAADLVSSEPLVRVRLGDRTSGAVATLEDYGMLADGLVDLALATGDPRWAVRARDLLDRCLPDGATVFRSPGGADPVLAARGLDLEGDTGEGAYPSGRSATARAAVRLASLGAGERYRSAGAATLTPVSAEAVARPIGYGGALRALSSLAAPLRQLVVVTAHGREGAIARVARGWVGGVAAVVTAAQANAWAEARFELFEAREAIGDRPTAYLCEHFVCRLPIVDDAEALQHALGEPAA